MSNESNSTSHAPLEEDGFYLVPNPSITNPKSNKNVVDLPSAAAAGEEEKTNYSELEDDWKVSLEQLSQLEKSHFEQADRPGRRFRRQRRRARFDFNKKVQQYDLGLATLYEVMEARGIYLRRMERYCRKAGRFFDYGKERQFLDSIEKLSQHNL